MNRARHSPLRGFTLLELLIAVAVLGISMAALIGGFARYAEQAAYLKTRTVATWVAHNALTDESLKTTWIEPGVKESEVRMAGQLWKYKLEAKATGNVVLRRLEARVYAPGVDEDSPSSTAASTLSLYMSCEGRSGC